MKKVNKAPTSVAQSAGTFSSTKFSAFDYVFPLLPFCALIPNFYIVPSLSYPGLATQEVGFAVAALLCTLLGFALTRKNLGAEGDESWRRKSLWIFTPLTLFLLWQTVSLTWAIERGEALRILGCWVGFSIFIISAWEFLRPRTAWWIYYCLLVVVAILSLSLWLEYSNYGFGNMQGVFFNHGLTAELLATILPLFFCVFLFEKQNRWAVVAAVLAMASTVAALMLTLRRGPLLGLVVAAIFIFLSLTMGKMTGAIRARMMAVILGSVVIVFPLVIIKREAIITRLRSATELRAASAAEAADLGLTSRATLWIVGWEMAKKHWLTGVGNGNYPIYYAQFRRSFLENPRYSPVIAVAESEDYDFVRIPFTHSEYLQIFAELGIIGLLLFLTFWAAAVRALWQARNTRWGFLAFGAIGSLLAFGVSSAISGFSFRLTPGIFIVASILALGWAVRESPPDTSDDASTVIQVPRKVPPILWGVGIFACLLLMARSYNVYTSQRTQGSLTMETQLDFSFALDNPPVNETSVRRYQRVLASDPYNAGAHLGLAVLLFQMKRLPDCLQNAEYAAQHGFNRPFTFLLRAFAHEHNNEIEKAQAVLREGIGSYPKSVILRTAYAEMLRKRGQPEEVQNQWSELEKRGIEHSFIRSWSLAMRYRDEEATRIAQREGLTPPGQLGPTLARVLTQARAYHYYRSIEPTGP